MNHKTNLHKWRSNKKKVSPSISTSIKGTAEPSNPNQFDTSTKHPTNSRPMANCSSEPSGIPPTPCKPVCAHWPTLAIYAKSTSSIYPTSTMDTTTLGTTILYPRAPSPNPAVANESTEIWNGVHQTAKPIDYATSGQCPARKISAIWVQTISEW